MIDEMYGGPPQSDIDLVAPSNEMGMRKTKVQATERYYDKDKNPYVDERRGIVPKVIGEDKVATPQIDIEKEDELIRKMEVEGVDVAERKRQVAEAKRKLGMFEEDFNASARYILSASKQDPGLVVRFQKIIRQATLMVNVIGKKDGNNPLLGQLGQYEPVIDEATGNPVLDEYNEPIYKKVDVQAIAPIKLEKENETLQENYVEGLIDIITEANDKSKLASKLGITYMQGVIADLIRLDLNYQIHQLEKKMEDVQVEYKDQSETLALRKQQIEKNINNLRRRESEAHSGGDMDILFNGADPMATYKKVGEIVKNYMVEHRYGNMTNPKYFEDILGLIMLTYGSEYGFDGERQLMDRNGKVYFHNFLKWIEDQMWYFSDFQDDDSFSGYQFIAFYTVFRQISLFEMIVTEPQKYFSKRGVRASNRVTGETEYFHDHSDPRYMNLRNYLVSLITPANTIHDSDVEYTKNFELRGEEFLNMMKKFYGSQTLTFNSRLLRFMSLLSTDQDEVEAFLTSDRKQNRIGGKLGQAMSSALLLHYHLDQLGHLTKDKNGKDLFTREDSDFIQGLGRDEWDEKKMVDGVEKTIHHMGGRRAFFQSLMYQAITKSKYASSLKEFGHKAQHAEHKNATRDYLASLVANFETLMSSCIDKDDKGRDITNGHATILDNITKDLALGENSVLEMMFRLTGGEKEELSKIRSIVSKTGMSVVDKEQALAFEMLKVFRGVERADLNFYNGPKSANRSIRNIVLEAIESSIQAEYNLNHTDAQFGAHFVSLMPSFMGIGAKNDTNIDSTQWWATVMQFKEYRVRNPKKVDVGDPETFNTIEQFLTFMEAIPVQVGEKKEKTVDENGNTVYKTSKINVPFYLFIKSIRDQKPLIQLAAEAGIADRFNLSPEDYPDPNMIGDPVILDNSMKNFVSQHLKGMVDIDGIIKKHKFDLMDVMKQESGTGKWIEDPQKTDENFFKLLGALRNIISKPSFSSYLNDKNNKIPVRRLVLDSEGKSTGRYEFVNLTLAEMMFHRNIRNTFVDQLPDKNGKPTIERGEVFVKQMIKFLATMSYERHKFKLLGGLTEADRQRESKWPTWTPERFMATDYFLMYNLLAEAMQYKDKYGEGIEDFIEVFHQVRGYFSKADIADQHKVSHTEYWGKWYHLGIGGMESNSIYFGILGAMWLAMMQQVSQGLSEATKFK